MKPIIAFGDSYSTGSGLGTEAIERHLERLAYDGGTTLANKAAGSNMSADQALLTYGVTPSDANNYTILITNDAAIWAANPVKMAAAMDAMRCIAVWCGAPTRINGRLAARTGIWANTPLVGNWIGMYNPPGSLPATMSGTVSGTAVYIQHITQTGNNFQCEVRIDGALVDTINGNGSVIGQTYIGNTAWPSVKRYGGLAAGAHAVELRPINAGQYTFIDAIYGSDQATRPRVVICKIPYRGAAGYAMYPNNSDANIDTYNAAISAMVAELASDGLNVTLVDAGIDPATGLQSDQVHPARPASRLLQAAIRAALL